MTFTSISEFLRTLPGRALKSSPLIALLLLATLTSAVPARAQSGDTWKSVAIIGGSTAAGALIGHKIGGRTGAYVGAAAGAAAGYAIDRRRRQNVDYNNGYYGDNGGYYGNNDPYYGNGGYYGNGYPAANGYPGNGYSARSNRRR